MGLFFVFCKSLVVYSSATDFSMLILCPAVLLNFTELDLTGVFFGFFGFLVELSVFFLCIKLSHPANRDNFPSQFSWFLLLFLHECSVENSSSMVEYK